MGKQKYNYEIVEQLFLDSGYTLLSKEYKNTNLDYKCNKGHIRKVNFGNFKRGTRCPLCNKGGVSLTYDFVYKEFQKQNCLLISTEYKNTNEKLRYICCCGNQDAYQTFSEFKRFNRCTCGKRTFANYKKQTHIKHTIESIKLLFEKEDCILLSTEYIPYKKLNYICKCKSRHSITLDHFINDVRCPDCGFDKAEKSGKTFKEYKFPSGEIRKIQGYEHLALDELIKIYDEKDIITDRRKMPKIKYYLYHKNKSYYPDIYILSKNLIIEVKSDYVYSKDIVRNNIKALATRKLNFEFEFWVYTIKKNKLKYY